MGTWNPQWDAREALEGTPETVIRMVGVIVGRPFHHHGLNSTYVDIERETPTINTATWGNCYPVDEVYIRTREAFNATISDLDRLIWHLAGHRDRLKAELETLSDRVFEENLAPEADHSIEATSVPAPAMVDVKLPETA